MTQKALNDLIPIVGAVLCCPDSLPAQDRFSQLRLVLLAALAHQPGWQGVALSTDYSMWGHEGPPPCPDTKGCPSSELPAGLMEAFLGTALQPSFSLCPKYLPPFLPLVGDSTSQGTQLTAPQCVPLACRGLPAAP